MALIAVHTRWFPGLLFYCCVVSSSWVIFVVSSVYWVSVNPPPSHFLPTVVGVTHWCFPLSQMEIETERGGGRWQEGNGCRDVRWKYQRGEMEDKNWTEGMRRVWQCQCQWGGEESSMKAAWLSTNWMSPMLLIRMMKGIMMAVGLSVGCYF